MKRVEAACICQTLHFMPKENSGYDNTVALVREEVEKYKSGLERSQTKHRILEEITQPDGSVILKIVKQYNTSPVGDYLD